MSDAVAEYVAVLDRRLRGPRRLRDDMLAEAASGLADAAEAYERDGMTAQQARERAVADFGAPADVLPGYQAELAADQARRSAVLVGAAFPGLVVAWDLLWVVTSPGPMPSESVLSWLHAADLYGLLVGLPAMALLVLLSRPYRRSRRPHRLALTAGWFALVAGTVNVALWVTFAAMQPVKMARMAVETPPAGVMLVLSVAVMVAVLASGRSSLVIALSDRARAGSRARSRR